MHEHIIGFIEVEVRKDKFDVIYHNQISWGYYNSGSKVCKDNNGNDCTDKLDELIESILINQR